MRRQFTKVRAALQDSVLVCVFTGEAYEDRAKGQFNLEGHRNHERDQ